jgi:uncharacterized membrane protein
MITISLEQGQSFLTLAVVAVATFAATVWFYRYIRQEISERRWLYLLSLRCLATVLLLLLLFRPVLSFPADSPHKHGVIFLVDNSASMATTDDTSGSTRLDRLRPRVVDWWQKLQKDFRLELISFSDRAEPLTGIDALEDLKATGEATSLTRALQAAGRRLPRKDVEAVILLSDGIQNALGDPVQTARKLGLIVHTVGVGSNLRNLPSFRDVQVSAMECPPQLVLNNQAKITANVESIGLAGRVVKVLLEEDGKVVDHADLTLKGEAEPQPLAFQFLPTAKGRHTYTVRIPVLNDEAILQNNQRSMLAEVVDARIRVLYLEGALRAEYGALVERFFSKDPDLEFCALVQSRRNVFVQRTNIPGLQLTALPTDPAVLEKFNVFVLGDLDSSFLKPAQMKLLAQRVRAGAGLVMLGGYNSLGPGGYGGTVLEEILPVLLGDRKVGQSTDPFLPVLTAEGRNHAIFANIARFFPGPGSEPQVAGLPPLQGCVRVAGTRPGATVLAVHAGSKDEKPTPILAVQPVGKGRSAVFTGDTTRNWQQIPRALDRESPFTRFWGQLTRWLANRLESLPGDSVIARTDKAYYEPDAPILISALVRDKEGEGTQQAAVKAVVQKPGGQKETVLLSSVSGSAGNYQAVYESKSSGTYEIAVAAKVGTMSLSAEKITVEVGRPNLEFDRLSLDDRMLAKIAAATGGSYHHLSTAQRLIEELQGKEQRRRILLEQPLYSPLLCWLLFVTALASEWFLRKRYHLR